MSAAISGSTRLAGVIGDPVRHSLSPALLNAAFGAAGLDWVYVAFPVAEGGAPSALDSMRLLDIGGLSVTMPHKEAVAAAVDRCSPAAAALRAVNCVRREGDVLVGENTDGEGFVRSLVGELGVTPGDRRCVVLGAGGAGRAVVKALADAGAAEVVVVNRTESKAVAAADLAGSRGRTGSRADVSAADIVVNSTPMGMAERGDLPLAADDLREGQVVVDLVYHPLVTPLLEIADAAGARTMNGLGMLLHQAAIQFELWTDHGAPIGAMRQAALDELASR